MKLFDWTTTTETLSGFVALKHRHTGELSAFGTRGEIYPINSTTYKVRFFNEVGFDGTPILTLPPDQLHVFLRKIGAPTVPKLMLECAKKDHVRNMSGVSRD